VLLPLLEPLSGTHVRNEVEVVVQIRMDATQAIEECTPPTIFALPTSLQLFGLDTLSDLTTGYPTTLLARDPTAKSLDLA